MLPLTASTPDKFLMCFTLIPKLDNTQTLTQVPDLRSGLSTAPCRRQSLAHAPRSISFRKEVIQPHLPIRLPCYDFTPVISPAFGSFLSWITDFGHYQLPWCDGRCVQDPGTYSPQHSDLRLLAIPASCSRVADYNPN